jgi:hypothetical protein
MASGILAELPVRCVRVAIDKPQAFSDVDAVTIEITRWSTASWSAVMSSTVGRERNKLSKRLHRLVGQAIGDFRDDRPG